MVRKTIFPLILRMKAILVQARGITCLTRHLSRQVWRTSGSLRSHVVAFQWLPAYERRYVRHAGSLVDEVTRLDYAETGAPAKERERKTEGEAETDGGLAQARWKPCIDSRGRELKL